MLQPARPSVEIPVDGGQLAHGGMKRQSDALRDVDLRSP
jgi:hypothetical protein